MYVYVCTVVVVVVGVAAAAVVHSAVSLWHVQKISEKPQVVNEYESGKAIPNQAVISKLERALGKHNISCLC